MKRFHRNLALILKLMVNFEPITITKHCK